MYIKHVLLVHVWDHNIPIGHNMLVFLNIIQWTSLEFSAEHDSSRFRQALGKDCPSGTAAMAAESHSTALSSLMKISHYNYHL